MVTAAKASPALSRRDLGRARFVALMVSEDSAVSASNLPGINSGGAILLAVRPWLVLATVLLTGSTAAAQTPTARPGVPPQSAWTCPLTHTVKGNFTPTDPTEYCIYHVPGGEFYTRTKPERCYSTEAEAVKDRCRRSKR
jgi:hypothetical protein